jgi:DNA-binding HxlR family transcriptional regulator
MARTNRYDHFCPVARSLEVIGEKWSLLIVRELLPGARRFTDLEQGLSNITPKWLTLRLRELEAAGLVERDQQEGRREVWYRLSPAGRELQPVVAALNVWGTRHAIRAPYPGEKMNFKRMLTSFAGYMNETGVEAPEGTAWHFRFEDGTEQDLVYTASRWRPSPGGVPSLEVTTSTRDWARMMARETAPEDAVSLSGEAAEIKRLREVLAGILSATPLTLAV